MPIFQRILHFPCLFNWTDVWCWLKIIIIRNKVASFKKCSPSLKWNFSDFWWWSGTANHWLTTKFGSLARRYIWVTAHYRRTIVSRLYFAINPHSLSSEWSCVHMPSIKAQHDTFLSICFIIKGGCAYSDICILHSKLIDLDP